MLHYKDAYIAGAWREIQPQGTLTIHDSFSEQPLAQVALAGQGEADAAVAAARAAFPAWSATPLAQRTAFLRRIAAELSAQADALAEAITREVGMPLKLARRIQVQAPIAAWSAYADIADGLAFESRVGHSIVSQEPVGVVACITPWNYPLHQITGKVAPALAAGCTVVLKPSELAPAAAYALARAIEAAGLPAGVFNLVPGQGAVVGEALVGHAGIDMVSFTGSTAAGRRVASLAGAGIKRVALELGGKSASVVLPDADLAQAMKHALSACFLNSGQTCTAITRVLVPRSREEECLALLKKGVAAFVMGDPCSGDTRLGPLVSADQRQRVQQYIDAAAAEGALRLTGGPGEAAVPAQGYFVAPTVLAKVQAQSRVAQEEVFGPVLSVIAYDDEDDAVRIANGTPYGLAAAVWSGDSARALAVARRLRAGQVDVNGAPFNPAAPFGGFGMSGIGRENGVFGLEEFLEPRAIQLPA
ncbi:MAG TPA: aldehyde dehydrogenase family protein [Ramlibacter sp.]|uniref:aldehyde dehydrogenase family protein n=1 Tax=Ramlibacter sp. TaxID=1917967 RepID=UPI002D7EE043|nr:aldehyde dehydrogenase family protein [Ramlibacter sp.]HET8745866.1 aldehyde dehydrogenase family protein [Ramlibacter sp.]